jgi:hypothetical protein
MNSNGFQLRWSERLYWAIVLLWAGAVVAADGFDLLPTVGHADAWHWIFLGAGLLAFGRFAVRLLSPVIPDRGPDASDIGFALVVTVLGLGGFLASWIACSVVLVVVGATLLIQALRCHTTPEARPAP